MFSQRREGSCFLYPSRDTEGPPEETLSPANVVDPLNNSSRDVCTTCCRILQLTMEIRGRLPIENLTTGPVSSGQESIIS